MLLPLGTLRTLDDTLLLRYKEKKKKKYVKIIKIMKYDMLKIYNVSFFFLNIYKRVYIFQTREISIDGNDEQIG